MKLIQKKLTELTPYPGNSRTHSAEQVGQIVDSINEFGFTNPLLIDESNGIIAGHGRLMAAKLLKMDEVPCVILEGLSDTQKKAYIIADNKLALNAGWDEDLLGIELQCLLDVEFDLDLIGFTAAELEELLPAEDGEHGNEDGSLTLADRFLIPPLSVLNARDGWWQDRKRSWLSLGIKSEVGRDAKSNAMASTFKGSKQALSCGGVLDSGISIFDPVVCELVYSWFSGKGDTVLDPFAGGSVRGVVAGKLGRKYVGVELRQEQVGANRAQECILSSTDVLPVWLCADSRNIVKECEGVGADFIFSCPPYADLEIYSDDPADLSTLGYEEFREAYFEIIKESCSLLKNDRFACFVVGEVRDKKGNFYDFVGDTVQAFKDAGLEYYNEAILVTCLGTVQMQTSRNFPISRKLGKTHQNILVFVKGDGKKAAQSCGAVDVYLQEASESDE
jgi:hypothetical protein